MRQIVRYLQVAWELARAKAENRRLKRELREAYGGGPIPMTRAQIDRLRELQKGMSPKELRQLGALDLDKDVVAVDD
jgi:hypothetical protein